jgi:hypothetical protein
MRTVIRLAGAAVAIAMAFSSCTCHEQVREVPKPTIKDFPAGFRAESKGGTTPVATPKPTQKVAEVAATPPGLPDDFPKEVPVFKGAVVEGVQDLPQNAHNVVFRTTAPVAEVSEFYQQQLKSAGWTVSQEFKRPTRSFATYEKGDMLAHVSIGEDPANPGQQVISIMYQEKPKLDFPEF